MSFFRVINTDIGPPGPIGPEGPGYEVTSYAFSNTSTSGSIPIDTTIQSVVKVNMSTANTTFTLYLPSPILLQVGSMITIYVNNFNLGSPPTFVLTSYSSSLCGSMLYLDTGVTKLATTNGVGTLYSYPSIAGNQAYISLVVANGVYNFNSIGFYTS